MTIKRIAFISDLQSPFIDEKSVKLVGKFLRKWNPHRTIQIGDEIDLPQLGGFNAGTIDEMVGNLDDDRKFTQEVLQYLGVTDDALECLNRLTLGNLVEPRIYRVLEYCVKVKAISTSYCS